MRSEVTVAAARFIKDPGLQRRIAMNVHTPVLIIWFAQGLGCILLGTIVYDAIIRTFQILNTPPDSAEESGRIVLEPLPLYCSLTVRQAQISPDCCLFQSREGRSLKGGAIASRRYRLKRLGILL